MRNQLHADLLEVAALLEKGWTQRVQARDIDGNSVPSSHPSATCWCILGAMGRVIPDRLADFETAVAAVRKVVFARHPRTTLGLATWNDTKGRDQAEVVAAVRSAAEAS